MVWFTAIRALFEALTEYLRLRSKAFYYDISERSFTRQDAYIKEIEKLRADRNPTTAVRINELLQQLEMERKRFADISAQYSTSPPLSGH